MPKPNVVLDTNVLVSSLWHGRCGEIIERWRDGRFQLAVSKPVLREYLTVLGRFLSTNLVDECEKWTRSIFLPTTLSAVSPERDDVSILPLRSIIINP